MPKSYPIRAYEREYKMIKEKADELNVSTSQGLAELIKEYEQEMKLIKIERDMLLRERDRLEEDEVRFEAFRDNFEEEVREIVEKEVQEKIELMVEHDVIRYVQK